MEQEIINHQPVYLNGWKRLFSSLLNLLISLSLAALFDVAFINKTVKNVTHYDAVMMERDNNVKAYMKLQDEYGVFYYDSESHRLINESLDSGVEEAFLENEEVIKLKTDIQNKDTTLNLIQLRIVLYSFLLGSLIGCTFSKVIFGPGRGLGEIIMHDVIVNEDGSKIKFFKALLNGFLIWIFDIVLGFLTLFILPIVSLKEIYYDDKHQSLLDKLLKIEHHLDERYID